MLLVNPFARKLFYETFLFSNIKISFVLNFNWRLFLFKENLCLTHHRQYCSLLLYWSYRAEVVHVATCCVMISETDVEICLPTPTRCYNKHLLFYKPENWISWIVQNESCNRYWAVFEKICTHCNKEYFSICTSSQVGRDKRQQYCLWCWILYDFFQFNGMHVIYQLTFDFMLSFIYAFSVYFYILLDSYFKYFYFKAISFK